MIKPLIRRYVKLDTESLTPSDKVKTLVFGLAFIIVVIVWITHGFWIALLIALLEVLIIAAVYLIDFLYGIGSGSVMDLVNDGENVKTKGRLLHNVRDYFTDYIVSNPTQFVRQPYEVMPTIRIKQDSGQLSIFIKNKGVGRILRKQESVDDLKPFLYGSWTVTNHKLAPSGNWLILQLSDSDKDNQIKLNRRISGRSNEIQLDRETFWNLDRDVGAIVAGRSGSGKTYLLKCIIAQGQAKHMNVIVLDPKRSDLSRLVNGAITDTQECLEVLEHFAANMAVKEVEGDKSFDLIVIDELAALKLEFSKDEKNRFDAALKSIALKGRSSRTILCGGLQMAKTEDINSSVRDQFGCRIQLGAASKTSLNLLFPDYAENYAGAKGQGICEVNGITKPFTAPTLDFGVAFEDLIK